MFRQSSGERIFVKQGTFVFLFCQFNFFLFFKPKTPAEAAGANDGFILKRRGQNHKVKKQGGRER